jgi:hypothetical protein
VSFKQHPEDLLVAKDPAGAPAPLQINSSGELKVTGGSDAPPIPVTPNGDVIVTAPDVSSLLLELIKEVKKSNIYLSLLVGEEVEDSDIEE